MSQTLNRHLKENIHIINKHIKICCKSCHSVKFSHSVVSTLCDPMNHSMPGLPVHHQLLEFTQTHVH